MEILVKLFIRSACACLALSILACEKEGANGDYSPNNRLDTTNSTVARKRTESGSGFNLQRLLGKIESNDSNDADFDARSIFIEVAKEDQSVLVAWIIKHANDPRSKNEVGDALVALSRVDMPSALKLSAGKKTAIGSSVAQWIFADFTTLNGAFKALALVDQVDKGEREGVLSIIAACPVNDPQTFVEVLSKIKGMDNIQSATGMYLRSLSFAGRSDRIMATMNLLSDQQAFEVVADPATRDVVLKCCPELAIDKLAKMPLTASNCSVFRDVLSRDPLANFQLFSSFINSTQDSPARGELWSDFYSKLAGSDMERALNELENLSGNDQILAKCGVVREMASSNPGKAITMASLSDAAHKPDLYREIARVSVYNHREYAVGMIQNPEVSAILGNGFRDQMLDNLVQNWTRNDIDAAKSWVERLPTEDQASGFKGLVASWTKSDPVAASDWLSKQPPGAARDAGARVIIDQIKNTDPEMAEQWRKSLSEQNHEQD